MVPVLLRRLFIFSTILCVLVPISWLLLRKDPLESNVDFVIQAQSMRKDIPRFENIKRNAVDPGVLIIYKQRSNANFRTIRTFFQALRIEHDFFYISKSRHVPKLVRTSTITLQQVGRYRLIVVASVSDFVRDTSVYELITEYCEIFDAVLILMVCGNDRWFHSNEIWTHPQHTQHLFMGDIDISRLPQSIRVDHLKIHERNNFVYAKDGGPWKWFDNNSIVTFWPHKMSFAGRLIPLHLDLDKNRFQILASVHYSKMFDHKWSSLPVALIDWLSNDRIQKVYIGIPMTLALTKLLLLEVINIFSKEHQILKFGTTRWIQIDIDDVFVAPLGSKLTESDVMALLNGQALLKTYIPEFKFNLGFCGSHYRQGVLAERKGDEMLVAHADKFNWFDHTYEHSKPHTMSVNALYLSLKQNKEFAIKHNLTINLQYSVSPHHSGIYPVYEPLYVAWNDIWNITVTSTEEYPHLRPDHGRRGYIHNNIKVLPRQTCRLFTHTTNFSHFHGGKEEVIAYAQGGDVFNTVLYNPVIIFMTHSTNYAKDRLAFELFYPLFNFIKQWTKIELKADTPVNIANTYFEIFSEDKVPLWTSPCNDRRHFAIWHRANCTQLPSFIILGPQKSGSTALQFFLKYHPQLLTSYPTSHAYEEIQFFSSENLYNKGVDWYILNFPVPLNNNKSQLTYEKSATYFTHSLAPKRIRVLIPDVKLIVILVDPVKRAYSWYQHMKFHSNPTTLMYNFSSVIKANKKNGGSTKLLYLRSRCLLPGLYHEHLQKWFEYFPENQVYFIDGDDLVNNPVNVLLEVTEFLGVEPFQFSKILRYNARKGFYCVLEGNQKSNCLGKSKGRKYPPLPKEDIRFLESYYSSHNRKLYQMLIRMSRKPPTWLINDFAS